MDYSSLNLPKTFLLASGQHHIRPNSAKVILFHDYNQFCNDEIVSLKLNNSSVEFLAVHDGTFATGVSVASADDSFIITSGIGKLNRDFDDVRRYADAAIAATRRLKQFKNHTDLHFIIQAPPENQKNFEQFIEVSMLAVLGELYEPLEVREANRQTPWIDSLKFSIVGPHGKDYSLTEESANEILAHVLAVESGRRLAKDIGSPDAERMSSINCSSAIKSYFEQFKNVKVEIIDDYQRMKNEYPLYAAVGRASMHVPRHAPRIVKLEYRSPDQANVKEDLIMVGKGINFDTGGADLKYGGAMLGMSRDKCGAAALAGLMAVCAKLQPTHVNLAVWLAFVRNSIGSDSYVCDEIIRARSGVRVRVGNTDAEGRMAMADLVCEARELVVRDGIEAKARILTCATLTGHVHRVYGPGYSAVMVNGPAKKSGLHERFLLEGELVGDPFEHSTIRREDYLCIMPIDSRYDLLQANDKPSSLTPRGHQFPMAFLAIASGLDKHANDAPESHRIAFAHLDIAASATDESDPMHLGRVTGSPIPTLANVFLRNIHRLK